MNAKPLAITSVQTELHLADGHLGSTAPEGHLVLLTLNSPQLALLYLGPVQLQHMLRLLKASCPVSSTLAAYRPAGQSVPEASFGRASHPLQS